MATYTIRPTSYIQGAVWTAAASGSQMATWLGDNSDATLVTKSNATGAWRTYFGLSAPTIPSTEFIARAGSFMRWKGGGDNGTYPMTEYMGVLAFRYADALPTTTPTLTTDGRSTITTTEVSLAYVNWSLTEAATLRICLNDSRSNSLIPTTTLYEVGATLYTLSVPTVTVANQTVTTSAKPTIAVSVTASIGWESSESDVSNMKRVLTQVRIESGGTGVGTGTLLSSNYVDQYAFASGTVNVPMPDALANGTYTIYARAVRFRDAQTQDQAIAATDQASAWSSATLTMNNPLPNAPTVSVSADQTNDRVQISVTPVATTGFTSPIIDVQRSDDGGSTWTTVRGWSVAGAFGSATTNYDYEMTRGVSVTYRARITATYTGGLIQTSNWTTSSGVNVTIAQDWNLKCPQTPALNLLNVQVVDKPGEELTEDLGVFRPLDRRYPVVVAGQLGGWDGDLTIVTSYTTDWSALKSLLESQKVLYLESPFGWSKYIRITSGAKVEISGTIGAPRRRISVSYIQVSAP